MILTLETAFFLVLAVDGVLIMIKQIFDRYNRSSIMALLYMDGITLIYMSIVFFEFPFFSCWASKSLRNVRVISYSIISFPSLNLVMASTPLCYHCAVPGMFAARFLFINTHPHWDREIFLSTFFFISKPCSVSHLNLIWSRGRSWSIR